jgi:hypothetical protein
MNSSAITVQPVRTQSLTPTAKGLIGISLVAIAIMAPTLIWGMPSSRDLTNHFRFALPFYDSLRAGNFHPGWLAESNSGFGDASFRFYPPALYYLLALFRLVIGNWFAATITTATFLFALGGFGVFFWARALGQERNAMWAGILYTAAPYHLNQFFQSFMLAEFAAAAILPFVFAFTERVCQRRRAPDMAGLAACYAILILTHLPLAVIASVALLLYAVVRREKQNFLKTLGCLAGSVAIGLAASSFYWITMLAELSWIRADRINPDPSVDYRQNFVLSTFSTDYLNVWWMNILLLMTAAMFWPAVALLWRSARSSLRNHQPENGKAIKAMAAVLLLTIFMATPLSRPLWNLIRPLRETQFPWRWLAITSIICPLLLVTAIPFWKNLGRAHKRSLTLLAAGTAAIALSFSASHIIREAFWLTPHQFEKRLAEIPGSESVSQWWPASVHEPVQVMSVPVAANSRPVTIESWTPERRVFSVGPGAPVDARIRTFFYPHWTATAAGVNLSVRADKDGAILIALPDNATRVTLEFREPPRVRRAAVLSLVGWMVVAFLPLSRRLFRAELSQ